MAYGGITPVGLPADWPVLVDAAVAAADLVVIGSGTRGSKLAVSGRPARRPADRRGARRPRPAAARRAPRAPAPAPSRAPDDSDVGWGERPRDPDDDDRRYLEDRPPHWGSD